MPTKNGERELRGRSSGDGPVMIAFSNRSQGLTTPSSAGRPMLPALPHRSKATLGAPGRVRHIRTQTESSGCAPDSLKSSGLSRSAWALLRAISVGLGSPPAFPVRNQKSIGFSMLSPKPHAELLGSPMGLATINYPLSTE